MMKAALIVGSLFALVACGQLAGRGEDEGGDETASPAQVVDASPEKATVAPAIVAPFETPADSVGWPKTNKRARIITSMGDIVVELYPEEAPKTVENFIRYASEGHYDRLIIHRVVPGFVIQGGGYNQYYHERPTRDPIPYEGDNGLKNYRSTIAMARTMDPGSASSQWFINLRDNNDQLDHFVNDLGPRYGYAVFGRVVEGMEAVDAIGAVATGPGGPFEAEAPLKTVSISRVDVIEGGE